MANYIQHPEPRIICNSFPQEQIIKEDCEKERKKGKETIHTENIQKEIILSCKDREKRIQKERYKRDEIKTERKAKKDTDEKE